MYTNLNNESVDGEIWVPILSYESNYLISNYGRVKSVRYNKIRKQKVDADGYLQITLSLKDKKSTFKVHRLLYFSFNPKANKHLEIDHKDGNRKNNTLENLCLCTHKQNCNNPITIQLYKDRNLKPFLGKKGKLHPSSKTVYTKNLETGFLKKFQSTYAAARFFKCSQHLISRAARQFPKPIKNHLFSYFPL